MAAGTAGSTSSPHIKQVIGCAVGVSWTHRVEINPTTLATVQELYINNATGATQVGVPAGYVPVACETGKDGEFTVHCDTSTTPPTPYLKRELLDFSTTPPTQTVQNFTLAGAAYTPTTEGVCEGYDVDEGCADVFSTATGVLTPVRRLQVTRFGALIGLPVYYSLTSNAVVAPAGTDRVLNCGDLMYSEALLCDSSSPPVPFWRTQYKVGSTTLFTQDLNVGKTASYGPVGAIQVCPNYTTDDEYACIAAPAGNDNTIAVRIVRVYANGSGTPISEVRTRLDTYAVVPNITPLVPCTKAAGQIRQGSAVVNGVSNTVIPAGKRSITLVVRSGAVTGSGSLQTGATQYRAGESYSWGVTEAGELLEAMTFAGTTTTTNFTITWTQLA